MGLSHPSDHQALALIVDDQALRAGCVSVLVKPCLPNVLLAEIRRVLARPGLPAA
jgi:DNA-binding response OmpR family regulator